MNKTELRKESRDRKKQLTAEERKSAEIAVLEKLESCREFTEAKRILAYYSLPDELQTNLLLNKWNKDKEIFLPRVNGELLDIARFEPDSTAEGAFSIQEPTGNDLTTVDTIDLIIIPAVGYDRKGNRLGRGKGYYDRLLKDATCQKIGIIYSCQLFDEVPAEPHDIPVDLIITETEIIKP